MAFPPRPMLCIGRGYPCQNNEAEINAKIEQLQRELDEHKHVLEL